MLNKYLRYLLPIVLGIFLAAASLALKADSFIPKHTPVPGGIAVLSLPESDKTPTVYFQGNRVMILKAESPGYIAIVGLPLSLEPGQHQIEIEGSSPLPFTVKDKAYKEQRITLKNKRQVNPYQKDLERIGHEKKEMISAFKHWRETPPASLAFSMPVDGPISSPFGLRRFFNDQPRKPHSGLDIAAPLGAPIRAPADGIVTAVGDYFFNGKTVMIDHGQGLVTMYCHMNEISVIPGQAVYQGEIIGEIGKTGRVTGPHLHWSVSLNDARIDPMSLLQ